MFWLAGSALLAPSAGADVLVVAKRHCPLHELSRAQVSDLYLGRLRNLPDGQPVQVIEQALDSPVRARFYRLLNGMSLKQLNAYWARLQFSGQVLPPPGVDGSAGVLEAVRRDCTAIGYLDAADADDTVHVLLRLEEER